MQTFKNVLMLVLLATALTACDKQVNSVENEHYNKHDFAEHCLNGVVYYVRVIPYKGFMAVKINRNTLLPTTCED